MNKVAEKLANRSCELMGNIAKNCAMLSTHTKHDFFFNYYPHCNNFEIHVNFNGWSSDKGAIYIGAENSYYDMNAINLYNPEKSSTDNRFIVKRLEKVNSRLERFLSGKLKITEKAIKKCI